MRCKADDRPKVYIAGPVSGVPDDNREAFDRAKWDLILDLEKSPVSPLEIHEGAADRSWLGYMRRCVPVLMACDEVYLLRGWFWSRGARWEFAIGRFLCGMKVTFEGGFWGGLHR